MTRAQVRAGLVLAVIVAAGWLIVPSTARASFPGAPGRFVFDGFRGFDYSLLWDWGPRTRGPRQLTRASPTCGPHSDRENDTWYDSAPEYSPNGRTIAYLHEDTCAAGESRRGLWLVGANGSAPRMLAPLAGLRWDEAGVVAFAPGGRRIAVMLSNANGLLVLLVVDVQTGGVLTSRDLPGSALPEAGGAIDWGRGGKIAVGGGRDVRSFPPVGGVVSKLSFPRRGAALDHWVGWDRDPEWSPTGRTIAFERTEQKGVSDGARAGAAQVRYRHSIWTAPVRKPRTAKRLTRGRVRFSPVFSPDGSRIAFVTEAGISVMPSGGGSVRLVVRTRLPANTLDWQPRDAPE